MSCICQRCGLEYKVDITIPDELWEKIKPGKKSKEAGLLCGSCIMRKIDETGDYDQWFLVQENHVDGFDLELQRIRAANGWIVRLEHSGIWEVMVYEKESHRLLATTGTTSLAGVLIALKAGLEHDIWQQFS
jgi:hypothetical protein